LTLGIEVQITSSIDVLVKIDFPRSAHVHEHFAEFRPEHLFERSPLRTHDCFSAFASAVKPGNTDEFFETQRSYLASVTPSPGLIGIRIYKSMDGNSAVLVTQYESAKALDEVRQRAVLKEHIEKVQPLVESSSQAVL
jgi:quinol monooxygenase YgiN